MSYISMSGFGQFEANIPGISLSCDGILTPEGEAAASPPGLHAGAAPPSEQPFRTIWR